MQGVCGLPSISSWPVSRRHLPLGCFCLSWFMLGNKFLSSCCYPPISLAPWECAKWSRQCLPTGWAGHGNLIDWIVLFSQFSVFASIIYAFSFTSFQFVSHFQLCCHQGSPYSLLCGYYFGDFHFWFCSWAPVATSPPHPQTQSRFCWWIWSQILCLDSGGG